ncbi:hypothetical protein VUJ46_05080 [Chryseobacterium sp. MYb264]|uniref:hypothetical protein n=1 Tax=Chryseobacterium sp. MYb264 TaxID=2745153 RepID=UPI002E133421|nr:hypothetical protein VUJ46_05080 [Chryseobacterium sp. MYb264]
MRKIFLVFIFLTTLYQCQERKNSCPDKDNYFIRNSLKYNSEFSMYEYVNKKSEDRFILINKNSNNCFINKNSLLSTNEIENYATNFIKRTKNGFYYSFEYGNRYHYEYEVYFEYVNGDFYLNQIVQKFSDLANPNSIRTKRIPVSKIKFILFDIHEYLSK